MNRYHIFPAVKRKRTESGFSVKNLGTVLLLWFLLPYLITLLMGNLWQEMEKEGEGKVEEQLRSGRITVYNKTRLAEEAIPLELYVADCLARTMDSAYEKEALKAQAVLIRTNLLSQAVDEIRIEDPDYGESAVPESCMLAAAETKGMYLEYEGKPAYGAYFLCSGGQTRNAGEFLAGEEYPYLKKKDCRRDFLCEEFTFLSSVDSREFERLWQLLPRAEEPFPESEGHKESAGDIQLIKDSAGYVILVSRKDKTVAGEDFRYGYQLPSANFKMSREEEGVFFEGKGAGHGLGMSQFGANEMAKQGDSFLEILNLFFEGANMTKIE